LFAHKLKKTIERLHKAIKDVQESTIAQNNISLRVGSSPISDMANDAIVFQLFKIEK